MRPSNILLILACLLMLAGSARAQTTLTVQAGHWSTQGVPSNQARYINFLIPHQPQTFAAPSGMHLAAAVNAIAQGGADAFSGQAVSFRFTLSKNGVMHTFQASGQLWGTLGSNWSDSRLEFTALKDLNSSKVGSLTKDPISGVAAIALASSVGSVWVDSEYTLLKPGEPTQINGYLQP